jgi:hypothetical protein
MMRIEADQWFIQQQQARATEQGLRQQQALSFAAGGLGQRASREHGGIDHIERPLHLAACIGAEQRQTPAMTVGAARDEIPAGEPQIVQSTARLRHVADRGIAARDRLVQHADRSAAQRQQA